MADGVSTKSVAAKSSITTKTSVLEQKRKLGISGIEEEEDKWEQFFDPEVAERYDTRAPTKRLALANVAHRLSSNMQCKTIPFASREKVKKRQAGP
ncbi:hypothetical protein LTR37_001430 [Vermiconidia calcicola]|uniref:Uncharacterized protein n=1 Tax=Vermiconidia calcicola TaxID=1690605 RepID=A0ACC3NXB1_9PEZI|nr:hypothetical protein LTR37_001430 [Vermiconidia calcicola]